MSDITDFGEDRETVSLLDNLLDLIAKCADPPTPMAQDAKNSTLPGSLRTRDSIPGHLLRDEEAAGGQLNPVFVEWLMGFPEGWTDLDPSEMPSSRKSQK